MIAHAAQRERRRATRRSGGLVLAFSSPIGGRLRDPDEGDVTDGCDPEVPGNCMWNPGMGEHLCRVFRRAGWLKSGSNG
jgi:hypothetical protein